MGGIDKHIRHYRTNHDTGERTLNTDFNLFVILNGVSYIAFLILIFTVGAFGGVSSTTQLLSYGFHSLVTVDELFFQMAWGFIIPWQGFWVVWQIANPAARNCEGVVRAAYFYPFAICVLYAGYTISVRTGMLILGCIFVYGLCGTLVGLSMTMNRYRPKTLKDYMIWQGPLTLMASTVMIEAMLMTNVVFVRLDETWIIKMVIAAASLLVIFITAIAWLSSYPVDLLIPFVLGCGVGGMYLELKNVSHYGDLVRQEYSTTTLEGWTYAVLAVFSLILLAFICKVIVVLIHQRPREMAQRRKTRESRVSVSITIDTGASNNNDNNNNNNNKRTKKNRNNKKNRRPPLDQHYGNNDYDNSSNNNSNNLNYTNNSWDIDSPPSTPVKKPKKKSSRNHHIHRDVSDPTSLSSTQSPVSVTPKKKKSSKTKKKKSSSRKPGGETSSTSYDNGDDDMV